MGVAAATLATAAIAITATPAAALTPPEFSKQFAPDIIGPGSVSTLTFTIDNTGDPDPVTSLAFTDVLPAGVTIASPAMVTPGCDATVSAPAGGSTISVSDGRLGGGSACTISVDVTSSTPGLAMNVSSDLTSTAGNSGPASDDLTVDIDRPGFSKSFTPSSVTLGQRSTLTFVVDNSLNASSVPNLDFSDDLPIGMEVADPAAVASSCGTPEVPPVVTASPGGTSIVLDADGTVAFPAVAAGAVCTVTVDVATTGVGSLDNQSGDLQAEFVSVGHANASLEVTRSDLHIEKEFTNDPVAPGGQVELEFRIRNFDRAQPAGSISFTDDLDATLTGLTFDSVVSDDCNATITGTGSGLITVSDVSLTAGAGCTIRTSLTVPAAAPGSYENVTSAVTGSVGRDPVTGDSAADLLFVEAAPVEFTKEFVDDPVGPGDQVTLRFTITNSDSSPVTAISFTDDVGGSPPPEDRAGTLPGMAANGLVDAGGLEPDPLVDPCGLGSELTIPDPNDSLPSPPFPDLPPDPTLLQFTGGSLAAAGQPGDSCTFDVVLDVPADAPGGQYLNTTSPLDADPSGAPPATDTLEVVDTPRLTKEFVGGAVAPGGSVTLRFELSMQEEAPNATAISFTDDLSAVVAGLTATSVDANSCVGSTVDISTPSLIDVSGASLDAGSTCTIDVVLAVDTGVAPGSYPNTTSTVAATVDGIATASSPATDDLTVTALTFTKEFVDDPVISGGTVTLRFVIANSSPSDAATGISFTDDLAAVLPGTPDLTATLPPTTNTCGGTMAGPTFLTYSGGSVAAASSCTIDVEILVPAGTADDTYRNTTSSLTADQGGAVVVQPATDDLAVRSELLQLTKEFTDDPVNPGDTVTLEFGLTNLDATRPISAVGFTDDLTATVAGLSLDGIVSNDCGGTVGGAGTGLISVSGAALAAGASCTIVVSLSVPGGAAAGSYTNTTSEVTGTIDGLAVFGTAAGDDLVVTDVDITLTKSFDGPTIPGGTATLTFTLTNDGADEIGDLSFTDDLDAVVSGLVATDTPIAGVCGGRSNISGTSVLTFSGGPLAGSGGTCSFSVEVAVPSTTMPGTYPNTTSALFQLGLPVSEPATADLVVEPAADISVTKTDGATTVVPGETTTYTIVVTNAGPSTDPAVTVTDTFPASLTCASTSTATGGATGNTTSGTGDIDDTLSMQPDSTVTYTATCDIDPAATGTITNTTTATASITDPDTTNDTATDDTTLTPTADITITKTDGATTVVPGETTTYTIVVTNAGPSTDPAVTVTDTFPATLTCASTSTATGGATGNTTSGTGDIDDTLSMQPDSTVTYTATCDIDPAATGTITNTTTATASTSDPDTTNDTATDDTTLTPAADISITKTGGPATVVAGGSITYTITVSNAGPSTDPAVTVTDDFAAGLACSWTMSTTGGADGSTSGTGDIGETISMPPGSTATYAATCATDPALSTTVTNTATASGSVTDPTPGNGSASAAGTMVTPPGLPATGGDPAGTLLPATLAILLGAVLLATRRFRRT